jgi:hypothetical protein
MKKTTPTRFIRWLLALTGADPTQTPIPSMRRPVDITVERNGDTHVAIISGCQGDGDRNGYGSSKVVGPANLVYLTGEVVTAAKGREEIEIITEQSKRPIRICVGDGLSREHLCRLREGDLIVLTGEIDGDCVRASSLYRLNDKPRKKIYG